MNLAACYRKLELPPHSLAGKETQVPLWSPHKRGGRPGPAQFTEHASHSLNLARPGEPVRSSSRHRGSHRGHALGTPKQGSGRASRNRASCGQVPTGLASDKTFVTSFIAHGAVTHTKQQFVNDPSAGSPTETLLRLLLSPSDRVRASSRPTVPALACQTETNPRPSLNRSIDSSDGRCVQRAGT